MAIYGIGIRPQDRWANKSANQFLVDGMTAEEWQAAGKGTFQQFYQVERATLQNNAAMVFEQAAQMAENSIMSFPLDGLLTTSSTIATKDFRQLLSSHENWSYFSNIVEQGSVAGRVFGIDLETFGDIQKGSGIFGITELAIGERIYTDGVGKMASNNLSLAIGITEEQANYLTQLVGDFKQKGWNKLSKSEQVTLSRLSMYSGNFKDVFQEVSGSGTVFQNNKRYYSVKKLNQEVISADAFYSGINNLRFLNRDGQANGITTSAEGVLSDFVTFLKARLGENSDIFKNIFYGANVKFDIVSLVNEMQKHSSLHKDIDFVHSIESGMLDVVSIVRAAAANQNISVGAYMERFGGKYTGASVDEQMYSYSLGGTQTHHGASDLGNEGVLVDFHKVNIFDKHFTNSETLSSHLQTHDVDDSVLFIRRGQLDKTTGNEFAYIPFSDDTPARIDAGLSITNEYWSFDTERSGIMTFTDQSGEHQKYVITMKNYADDLNQLGDKSTRFVLMGDTQAEVVERFTRLVQYDASDIFSKQDLTAEVVTGQQALKYVDEARREFDRLFDVNDVRSEQGVLTGGYDKLKSLYQLHTDVLPKWEAEHNAIETVDDLHLALKDIYKDAQPFDRFGDSKKMPIHGRYQMQAFLEMRPRFNSEKDLISDIIEAVDKAAPSNNEAKHGSTNLDRTIMASRMYDHANDSLLKDHSLATKKETLSYYTDLHGLDLIDSQGKPHRVDGRTTTSMASRISKIFENSSQEDITAMLTDLRQRKLISKKSFESLSEHVQLPNSAYNVATDLAYQIQDARAKNKKLARQVAQNDLLSNQTKTYINSGGVREVFSQAYGVIRQSEKDAMSVITSSYQQALYTNTRNNDTLLTTGKDVLTAINMGGGQLDEKAKLIAGMFNATEYGEPGRFKPYAINGRDNIQSFIVTPPTGTKGNAYLFLTTNDKVGGLMEALNSDRFKDAFASPTALRDSGIFEHGAFITLPYLNAYPTGQEGVNLYSVRQGPASEKFLMPELSVSLNKDGKLRGYFNDPEYGILGLYRKVGKELLDAVENKDFERAYRIYQRNFNEYLKDKPASSSYRYRDGKRMIHFGAGDIMHAHEMRLDGLETIFKKIVVPGATKDAKGNTIYHSITANNLNIAQQIVDNFGHVLGMSADQYNGRYDKYFKDVMNSHEFKEFLQRRMVFGSPAEEKWFDGVYQQEAFNKPLYQIIKDFAASKDAEAIFDHSLIKTIKGLPEADQITPLGSESSVARGAYFLKKHGSFVPFAGNYSTMRPMYTQQLNAMAFDISEMRKDIDVEANTAFKAAQFGRDFTPISIGTQLLEEDTYKMMTALKDVEGTFTGEHDFITRVKTMDIDALQQAYERVGTNKEALAENLANILTADQISKFKPGDNGKIDYASIFDTTLQYMKQEMSSTYQDKVFISSALQNTHLFMQRDPIKLQFNLDSVDIKKTRQILYDLLGDKESVELDTDTIIGRRKNGTAIFYNKAKAFLTKDNIEELLSEEADGLTRLATEFGDIMDDKMFFNGMEKATVHTINTHLLAQKIFKEQFDANSKEQLQIASTISSYLFNELSDGALAIGSFRFGKHGGLVGSQSIWNTITKNYLESNNGAALESLLITVAAEGSYAGLGDFKLINNRLVGNTALASKTSDFIDAVYARVKAEAQTADSPLRELSQRIVNEVNDLVANSSLNMTASRANMNEHLGVRLAVDQRMDQVIRMRGLRTARNVQPGEEIGLQALDMNYADELRRQAEAYNARGNGLHAHGLTDLQKAMNDISVGRNYERIQRNTTQQDMRRTLRGVVESIDYLDSHFLEDSSLRRGADYVHERGIVEVDAKTLLESTQNKGNIHLLRSGGTLEEAEQGLFYVNGKPSKFLQQLADKKGFILDDSTHSFWIDMSGYDVTVANPKGGSRVAIDGFLLPIQNISDMSSDDGKLFFQTQQGKVAHFIDEIADTVLKNKVEKGQSVGSKLGDLYSKLMQDLNEQTELLDKDSDLYKSIQQYVLPNSHELLALDEAAPLLNDSPLAADVRKYNQQRKDALIAMSKGNGAYDKALIEQYTEANNNFKSALQKLADSVVEDKDAFNALSTLGYNKALQEATDVLIDGQRYHGLSVALSEEGVEKLGYSFGNIAMDIVADFEHNKNLQNSTIERLDDFAEMMRAKDVKNSLEFRIKTLHGELQKEFSKELDDLFYFGYQWDSTKNVTDELNRFMAQVREGKFKKSEALALFDKEIEIFNDPNSFIYKINKARSQEEFDITIRSLNEDIARRAEKVFKQSQIGQDYFANIGTYSEFMRFPAFRSQPLVRILLDKSMNGQSFMARITNPILSLLSNLDFDGDKIFLGNVANGSSVLRTDSVLFQQQDAIYKRFITTEAPELLREAILSADGYVADNPNDNIFQKAKLLEIADSQAYDKGIRAYLKKMGFDENLNLKLAENAGILEAAVRSKEMSAVFGDALPNTLLNTNMQVASLVARIRKNNIGYISTPNYKIKEALMQAQQYFDLQNDPKSNALISDTLQGLTNMFSQAGGIFDMAEQKAIDVKHAKDGLDISYATRYSSAMYNLMSMDYAQEFAKSPTKAEGRIYDAMYSAIRAIGPKTLGVKDTEDIAWFAKVLSERHTEQLSHEYLFDIIQQVQKGKNDIILHGRTVDKETAGILLQALPLAQLTDIVRTAPQVAEIFNNIVYHDSYRSISKYLHAVAGQEISEADYRNIVQRTFGYDHSSAFGPDVIDIFTDSESRKIPTFVQGNIYYTTYGLKPHAHENKIYVFDGMKDGQYLFTELKSKGKGKSISIGASNVRSLDNFFAPKNGVTLSEFYNNRTIRQQIKDESTTKFAANVLNSLTISKADKILTSKPTIGKNASWVSKAARFQPWGWKFANHLLGQDKETIKATYTTLNQYAKAYNLGLASKIFGNNAPDSAAGMIRQVNEAIANRPRTGSKKIPSYQAHAGSWAAEAYGDFVQAFGGASIFDEYLERANNLPEQFDTTSFVKQIEDLDQNLYNVANEIAEAEASYADLNSAIETFKSDKDMSDEVKRLQGQYSTRDTFLQKHRTFLNDANKARVSTLQNSIYGANGIVKTQAQMDAVFNWRTAASGNMLVGFGSYFGKSFKQLSAQDIVNINHEAESLIKAANGAPLPQLEQYAIDTTVRLLKNFTPTTSVSAIKSTAMRSGQLADLLKTNRAIIDTTKATKEAKKAVKQAQQEAKDSAQAAAKAANNAKRKTLTGSILDSIQDMGLTKKHVGIAIGAMAALGITNKLLHRDSQSPLARSESGRNAPPDGQGQSGGYQNGAPASGNVVYHQDSRSGLTFKVSAKTQRRINAANNGSLVRQAGGGNANIYTYNDTSGINDNWLANKFAELAQ